MGEGSEPTPQGEERHYGIFSSIEADSEGEETLYRIEDDATTAIKWLARHILFRVYGEISTDSLIKAMQAFDKLIETKSYSKAIRLGGIVYYIRILTPEEKSSLYSEFA